MTVKDLEGLRYHGLSVERYQKRIQQKMDRIEDLKCRGLKSPTMSDMPRSPSPRNLSEDTMIAIASLEEEIDELKIKLIKEEAMCRKAEAEFERIVAMSDDPKIQLALRLRFIDCLYWYQVADRLGGGNTDQSIYMAVKRFLEKI